jgi:hypothetical protein
MKDGGKSGPVFLFLFGIPFAGVGLFMGWLMVRQIGGAIRAEGWPEAPAMIVSAELRESSGDDSTTYEARASYTYEYNGREYHGTHHVEVHRHSLVASGGLFGIGRTRIIPAGEIKDVLVSVGARSGYREYLDLKIDTASSRATTIAGGISDRQAANLMRQEILQVIGHK